MSRNRWPSKFSRLLIGFRLFASVISKHGLNDRLVVARFKEYVCEWFILNLFSLSMEARQMNFQPITQVLSTYKLFLNQLVQLEKQVLVADLYPASDRAPILLSSFLS